MKADREELRSYPLRREAGDTDRELVAKTVDESPIALTTKDIGSEIFGRLVIKTGELRKILLKLLEEGRIEKADYTVTYSRKPRIDVVVATVYYANEQQRRRYERQILPDLEGQVRANMQERNTRQGEL